MSLEESMSALAASNLKLAEANVNAAKLYAQLIERLDGAQIDTTAAAATPAPAAEAPKPRGRPKKEVEPKAEPEDDGLDEEEETEVQRTSDEVKGALKVFKEAGGAPRDIMSKFGAKSFPEVKESDFNAVHAMALKELAKL